ESGGRHLPGYLGDPNRTVELVGRSPPREYPADIRERAVDNEPSLLGALDDSRDRTELLRLNVARRHRAADAQHAEPVHVAEIVLQLLELRCRLERDRHAPALNLDRERFAGADADDALHVGEVVHLLAVDGGDEIARLEAGGLGGTVRLDRVDAGAGRLLADRHEDDGEDDDGEDEIG